MDAALRRLSATAYRHDVSAGQSLGAAQDAVWAAALWDLRVVAGWLPRGGASTVTATLAGYWEIANMAQLLASFEGTVPGRVFDLGGLGVAWRRVRTARSPADIRAILATSVWGDPGTVVPADMLAWLRLRWAERIAADVPGALRWAAGLFAVLGATTRFGDAGQTALPRWPTGPTGADWLRARSIADMKTRLPRIAAWPLEGVTGSADLWRAEARWWTTVEREALELRSRFHPGGRELVTAAITLMLVDAWRVRGALEIAARGGRPLEAIDALG